jgi:hypothetical protein
MTQTIANSSALSTVADIVSDLGGQSGSSVEMMIGIGLVKDSDAVFFQYLGEEQQPSALMLPSGKPCTRMANVRLTGLSIADGIGEFNSTKLNIFISTSAGRELMLTSGLTTIWSQCVITSLMGLFNSYNLGESFTLDTWKGTSKMRPCFAAIRQDNVKVSDQMMYDQLRDLRADGAKDKLNAVLRDAVEILNGAVTGGAVQPAEVVIENEQITEHPDF